jgi:GH25 family lysozyme M1 (1,4-beta-N-acetylmuramidase)
MAILYADVSAYQGKSIDWKAYCAGLRTQGNSAVIAAIKATEGVGYTDPDFEINRQGALAAGVDIILYYGFARPDLHNNPVDEANWLFHVVGAIRTQDLIMLDIEIMSSGDWSYQWLTQQQKNYGGKVPVLYSYDSFIRSNLQDSQLKQFPLIVANYTYNEAARPACPPPWSEYLAIQFSDKFSLPGIPGEVDANIFLGEVNDMAIDINSPGVSAVFTEQSATSWLCKPTGKVLHDGMLSHYKANNGLALLGLVVSDEVELGNSKSKQYYQFGCRQYAPGVGVTPAPVYRTDPKVPVTGEDPLIADLETELTQAQSSGNAAEHALLLNIKAELANIV